MKATKENPGLVLGIQDGPLLRRILYLVEEARTHPKRSMRFKVSKLRVDVELHGYSTAQECALSYLLPLRNTYRASFLRDVLDVGRPDASLTDTVEAYALRYPPGKYPFLGYQVHLLDGGCSRIRTGGAAWCLPQGVPFPYRRDLAHDEAPNDFGVYRY